MSHTSEPWVRDDAWVVRQESTNDVIAWCNVGHEDVDRIVACVNACAGLTPLTPEGKSVFRECVEALELVRSNAVDWTQFPDIIEKVEQALAHSEQPNV